MLTVGDGEAINAAWADDAHADRKLKAKCWRCDFDKHDSAATVICLTSGPDPIMLCDAHGQLALIAGWGPVPLDSDKGRAALERKVA